MWDSPQFLFCGRDSEPVRWHHRHVIPDLCHRLVRAPTRPGTQQPTLTERVQPAREHRKHSMICDKGSECRLVWPLRIEGITSPFPLFSWDVEHTLAEVMWAKEGQAKNYILAGRTVCALFLGTATSQKANQTKTLLGFFPVRLERNSLAFSHPLAPAQLFCREAGRESRHTWLEKVPQAILVFFSLSGGSVNRWTIRMNKLRLLVRMRLEDDPWSPGFKRK